MNSMKRAIAALLFGFALLTGVIGAQAGTTFKTVKAGETVLVHTQSFVGGVPPGLKSPKLYIVQPQNGKITARKSSKRERGQQLTVFEFYYTPKKGFKGVDRAEAGISMNMIIRGKSAWTNISDKLVLRVK